MAIDFPNSPSLNQTYTVGSKTWSYDGEKWVLSTEVTLGTDTAGNYVAIVDASGTGISISGSGTESASVTITSNATNANTPSTIVSRDASGNFSAGTITAALSGNASTASALQTARTISLTGDVSGSVSFDGSADASITATIQANSVALGTDTTGNYVSDVSGGTGVTVTHTPGEGSTPSIAIGQAVGTSASVTFAAVTAPLIGNASTATTLQNARTISLGGDLSGSVSFDGSSDVTISATVQPDSVALGTDTTGNYMSGISAGTGLSVSHTPSEGSTATVSLNATLDDLSDVSVSSPTLNDFLKWNGSQWVSASAGTATTDVMTDTKNAALLVMDIGA